MTVSAGPSVKTRTPAVRTRPDTTGGRSGAALRAYERRQQRQSIHESDAARPGRSRAAGGSSIAARIPFVALIIGMLALGMGVTLLLTTRAAADSYSLSEAKAVNLDLVQQQASLQRDVELADSAPELARKAAELGMVPAGNVARLLVGPDGGVQVVGTPSPADGKPVAPLDAPATLSPNPTASAASARPQTTASAPARSASSPGAVSPGTPVTTTPSAPTASTATPSAVNGAGNRSLGEQLVPMTIATAAPAGSGQ